MNVQPGQSLASITFMGAAVLPITYWEKSDLDNEKQRIKYLVLGREAEWDGGAWDAFGGARDTTETNPLDTATRKFEREAITQETLGLDYAAAREFIDVPTGNTPMVLVKYIDSNGMNRRPRFHVLYMTEFSPESIKSFRKKFFPARAKATNPEYHAKNGIALVRWDDLREAIIADQSSTDAYIEVAAHEFDPETNKNKPAKSRIALRQLLVKTLRPFIQEESYGTGENDKIRFYQ